MASVSHLGTEDPIVRRLSKPLPGPLGALLATIIVLIGIALFIWSLVETWEGRPDATLPLFQVSVAVLVVCTTAVLARKTFSWVVALIGAIAWIWISVLPLVPFIQVLLQAVCVTVMLFGVDLARGATAYLKTPHPRTDTRAPFDNSGLPLA